MKGPTPSDKLQSMLSNAFAITATYIFYSFGEGKNAG